MSDIPAQPSNVFAGPGYVDGVTSSGSGGGGSDIDARLKLVEVELREIKTILHRLDPILARVDATTRKIETETLPKLQVEVAEMKGRVAQLPTSLAVLGYIGSLFGLAIAIVTITIGLSKFLGH